MTKNFLILILLAVAGSLESFALGLPEKGARYRALSLVATLPIAVASALACVRFYEVLPLWFALPGGMVVLGLGFAVIHFIVDRIVPKKIKSSDES